MTELSLSKSLPLAEPKVGHFVLPYSHARAATANLSVGQSSFADYIMTLRVLGIILVCAAIYAYFTMPMVVLPVCVIGTILLLLLVRCEPTHVEVNANGLRLHFHHPYLKVSPQWISWDSITHVSYLDANAGGSKAVKCIDISVDLTNFTARDKFALELFTSLITLRENPKLLPLRLIESGFVHATDQAIFRNTLCDHIPVERISSELLAREEFGEVPTYTALWLNDLRKSPNVLIERLAPGTLLANGAYELIDVLGAGGQSIVYDALNLSAAGVKESCVVKQFVLPIRGGHEVRKRTLENIQREAKLLQTLDNPRIVKYRDLFVEGSLAFLVMEKIDGRSLRDIVSESGPLDRIALIHALVEMTDLLAYLHSQAPPVVHRDFTPENLMQGADKHLRVIDFNVAQRLESNSTKTVVGKHAYLPPEQFQGKPTVQSDIYALGATAAFLATGEDPEPLTSSNLSERRPDFPMELIEIIAKCTEPVAHARYQDSHQLADALKKLSTE